MIQDERPYSFSAPPTAGMLAAMQASETAQQSGDTMRESIEIGLITGTLTWFIWRALDNIFDRKGAR